jgi:hypothetical protein
MPVSLDPERTDHARATGVAVVTSWRPEDLERKFELEARLAGLGMRPGAAMEEAVLAELRTEGIEPLHRAESHNTLVDVGRALWCDLLIGAGGTVFNNANAALGVGDSAAAYASGQVNLQGAVVTTDRIRKAMDATYPSRAANVITFRATFAVGEANFVWNEWGLFNALADATGTMLNRAVANLGTKTNAVPWQLTVTITLT